MHTIHDSRLALALLAFAFASMASAAESTNRADPVASAPADVQAFLKAAEQADRLPDPLARCLAFPDVPGNKWPAGLARQHCQYVYGNPLTVAAMHAMLERGDVARLEARFAADLERHFDAAVHDEVLHRHFAMIEPDEASDRLTARWLELRPDSAFALGMRGTWLGEMAQKARGGKFAQETPDENMKQMNALLRESVGHYERALEIEPRLLPGYAGMIYASMRVGDERTAQLAWEHAHALDPGCVRLARLRMISLQPRWLGSYDQMHALAASLLPLLDERPMLAHAIMQPALDQGTMLARDEQYDAVVALLTPVLLLTSDPEPAGLVADALNSRKDKQAADLWPHLVASLAAARFEPGSAYDNRVRGRLLTFAQRPAWATRYLRTAVAAEPDNAGGHYLLAGALSRDGKPAQSEPEYLLAMRDPKMRQKALEDLVRAHLIGKAPDKALPYARQYRQEYPDDPLGWLLVGGANAGKRASTRAQMRELMAPFEAFVAMTADGKHPDFARQRVDVEAQLAEMRAALPKLAE